jgi:hypothetical protein
VYLVADMSAVYYTMSSCVVTGNNNNRSYFALANTFIYEVEKRFPQGSNISINNAKNTLITLNTIPASLTASLCIECIRVY